MSKADKIIELFVTYPDFTQRKIAKIAGVCLSTVEKRIANYKSNISNERREGVGRPTGPVDRKMESKELTKIKARPCDSVRDLARKCKTSASMVQRVKARNDLVTCVKQKRAKKSDKQYNEGIKRAKKLSKILKREKNSCLAMDDETYVKKHFVQNEGKQFYTKKRGETLDESITTTAYDKFPAKKMVWQTICECGLRSSPYFCSGNMNADIYIEECLKKRFLPFVRKHNCPVIFWADLASIHYAKKTLKFLNDNNIMFIPKEANPAAVSEDRPIETYWAQIKRELMKEPKAAGTDEEFKYRWNRASNRVSEETVKSMMRHVRQKVKERSKLQPKIIID